MRSAVAQVSSDSAGIAVPTRVLVADDDDDLRELISFSLRQAGFQVDAVVDGIAALSAFDRERYALLVLDINTPKLDSIHVCEYVREHSMLPILILSTGNLESDLVQALEVGADGYIVKPFSPRSLIARIRALLRRTTKNSGSSIVIETGKHRLDIESQTLVASGQELRLTRLELKILQILMLNANQIIATRTLVTNVWLSYSTGNRKALKQVVFRLRKKLTHVSGSATTLVTAAGGYMWRIAYE